MLKCCSESFDWLGLSTFIVAGITVFVTICIARQQMKISRDIAKRQEELVKEQLRLQRDTDLLLWGHEAVDSIQNAIKFVMTSVVANKNKKFDFEFEKINTISKISVLIDRGRWFMPNIIDEVDDFGKDKPEAYRGFRQVALDAMVYSYDILIEYDEKNISDSSYVISFLDDAKREMVSEIQKKVDPRRLIHVIGEQPAEPFWMRERTLKELRGRQSKKS